MNAHVRNVLVVAFFAVALSSTSLAQTDSATPGSAVVGSAPPSAVVPAPPAAPATPTPQPPAPPAPPPAPWLLQPPPGYYPPPAPMVLPEEQRPGYHKHDGLYLRLTLGAGYLHTHIKLQGTPDYHRSLTLSGVGPAVNLALGGAVAPNLILFCQYSSVTAKDPKMERVGDVGTLENDREMKFFNLGPGVAYYFDSLGLYLSGAVTAAWMTQSDGSIAREAESDHITDKGLGTSLMVGKEWWVSRNWGLGVASMFEMASMKSRKEDAHWFTTALSFLFSATFN